MNEFVLYSLCCVVAVFILFVAMSVVRLTSSGDAGAGAESGEIYDEKIALDREAWSAIRAGDNAKFNAVSQRRDFLKVCTESKSSIPNDGLLGWKSEAHKKAYYESK